MKLLILLLITFFLSCQAACIEKCECSKFSEINNLNVAVNGEAGCVFNATCEDTFTVIDLIVKWSGSDITKPSDAAADGRPYFYAESPFTGDLMTIYGIICENGTWYATKYPEGIKYWTVDNAIGFYGTSEELNGHKSPVYMASCYRN
uniref:Fibrinogen C-terminal domain-containing protein n=1 Tax=Caenorhabditis tropicalis TaxID=1561998 RepID=A0A1I7UZK2_9PELO